MFAFLDSINAKISISNRLRIVGAIMVLPVIFTGYLLFKANMEAVDVAKIEQRGVDAIAPIWQAAIIGAGNGSIDGQTRNALDKVAQDHSDFVKKAEIDKFGGLSGSALLEAASDSLAQVNDASGLILDPESDSFFVMQAVNLELVDMVNTASQAEIARQSGKFDIAAMQTHQVTDHMEAIKKGLAKLSNPADFSELLGAQKGLEQATAAFVNGTDPTAYKRFLNAADVLHRSGDKSLAMVFDNRIKSKMSATTTQLGTCLVVLILAMGLMTYN